MKIKFLLLLLITVATTSFGQIYFEDGFEVDGTDAWTLIDNDGDTQEWGPSTAGPHSGTICATSASWNSSPLTPDNYIITPAIDLEDATGNITLEYWVRAQDQVWPGEHYSCLISTVDGSVAELTTVLMEETLTTGDEAEQFYFKRSIDLSSYAGELIWIAWRHYDCTDFFRLNLDDVKVFSNSVVDAGVTAVTAPSNDDDCALTATEDVTVTIFNYGGADISGFDVSYSVDGGTPVTETFTGTIGASASMDYTFSAQVDLSTLGYYSINASVNLTDDSDSSNDAIDVAVSNGDANLVVEVQSDNGGGQEWTLTNSDGDVIATHGGYQWDITETTTVCVIDNDCYTFTWTGGVSNVVTLTYNGTEVNVTTATGDYEVLAIGGNCADNDASLTAITAANIIEAGSQNITGIVQNTGSNVLTSFDITYNVDGGTESAVYSVTGVNIVTSASMEFTHDVPFDFGGGAHTVIATVSNPNGMADEIADNNSASGDVLAVNEAFVKAVVGEEATGTWCGYCPRGTVALTDLAHNVTDGSWIGIAVHNGDPMANAEYDAAFNPFHPAGYPSGSVNRAFIDVDPAAFPASYDALVNDIPLAKVEVSLAQMDGQTREVTVDASTIFALDLDAIDARLSLIIVENEMPGTGGQWPQTNYYDGGGNGPLADWTGFDWTTAGDPVTGLTYNHVGREIIGGFTGVAGSVPASVTYNASNDYTFNFTLNDDYDEENIEIVVLLLDNATGQIMNAVETEMDIINSNVNIGNPSDVNVFPNPTTGNLTIDAKKASKVHIYNMVGKLVYTTEMTSDIETINLSNLNAGTYFVEIFDNNVLYSKKVVLTK